MKKIIILFGVLFVFAANMYADIKLPAIIADHMVLKQNASAPLWGTEIPGKKLTVETGWDNKKYETTADAGGNWVVKVNTPKAGGPYKITISGSNKITLSDVLIGEVWFSSGQSNMAFRMRQDVQADVFLPKATNTQIRMFKPGRQIKQEEERNFAKNAAWSVCSPESAAELSAMSYYFAIELQEKLQVPVGIINASWGGTSIESWMPKSAIDSSPVLQNPIGRWKQWVADFEKDSIKYAAETKAYEKNKTGEAPKMPESVYMMARPHRQYSVLYNGMVAPCTPYALSGLLWYQGTSSVGWADEYELQLNTLIKTWREAFGNPDMPVIVGQLTAFKYKNEDKAFTLRQAQFNQQKLKNVYAFCSMEYGDMKDIHPTNKQPYGLRFAGLALNKVYGMKNIACAYPTFKSIRAEGNKLIITFDGGEGLYMKGDESSKYYYNAYRIAGADGKFADAKAEVKNNQLIVYSDEISEPKQVRYLYYNTSFISLFNSDNLPAFPFEAKVK